MQINTYCPKCKTDVAIGYLDLLTDDEFRSAITRNADVRVMHTHSVEGDHIWTLNDDAKAKLRNRLAEAHI
jgi:hypothetical protein